MQKNSKCKCVDFDSGNRNELYGHFVFTSLEKGEGITIGNMLRRTLLSNLYGFRVVGARFNGINNEFEQLEGVREDILEIILNLKEIILINYDHPNRDCFGFLKVQGPAIVTAGCFTFSTNVRIINPDTHILTISDKSIIELAVKIEHGKSYVFAKDQKIKEFVDFIPIDSNFAPVLKVNWYNKLLPQDIENNNEELHLEIFTNGTLLPHRALIQARNIIGYMLSPINNMEFPYLEGLEKKVLGRKTPLVSENTFQTDLSKSATKKKENSKNTIKNGGKVISDTKQNLIATGRRNKNVPDMVEKEKVNKKSMSGDIAKPKLKKFDKITNKLGEKKGEIRRQILETKKIGEKYTPEKEDDKFIEQIAEIADGSLKGLGLSNRIINALKNSNINYVWDLIAYPASDLIAVPGLGKKSVEEINDKLNNFYEAFAD